MNRILFNRYIADTDFRILFNELGWDHIPNVQYDTSIPIDDIDYEMKAIARKSGFIIYTCEVEGIPQNQLCRKIDMRLRRYSNDYILIFHRKDSQHHLWIAPIKTVEKRDLVTIEYVEPGQADFLFSKLDSISFDIDEEVTIVDVTARIHEAFVVNSGKITKDFYAGFKKQHNSFVLFIDGIDIDGDKQWYASVMLNRLMFCYFIQKKGFLNFDTDYLRHKFEGTKQQQSENTFFQSFYKGFLCALFHGGLNHPQHNAEFEKIYGRIPYLNGGMFDEHQIEKQYKDIDIADEAFENLFSFFDKWRWHLDTRITATGKDINPDVLGYIFEQYINDRAQMGAYYTKEDITEYIGKNCIIPFLVDEVVKTSSGKEFKPNGFVWEMLKNSGDRYIYGVVKKGIDKPLPDYIEQGIDISRPNLLERRTRWNEKTNEDLGLPTEIWRETIERRNRCLNIQVKIANGEITNINDFITYNLDIRSFVYDLLAKTKDHLLVKHFYAALQKITILDPTCGSGAFLFAALNILEPLYEICIDRMEEFHTKNEKLFIDELVEIKHKYRSNIQHFIYKSIILRNLYGVDMMVEATEIAKLRLFLKMVAVVDVDKRADNLGLDPLPDIDFNIRCGNTLVGYATEEELSKDLTWGDMFANQEFKEKVETEMQKVAMAYDCFKDIQLNQQENIEDFKKAKTVLNERLSKLNDILNHRMYGSVTKLTYNEWLSSHQPFHWLAEFYQIIQGNRGFDVIIGNPPYVALKEISYKVIDYNTLSCGDIYALCIERSITALLHKKGIIGMIVPISIVSTDGYSPLRKVCSDKKGGFYFANFGVRPSKLFDGVDKRLTVFLSNKLEKQNYTTKYYRWVSEERATLFENISYQFSMEDSLGISGYPKISLDIENKILATLHDKKSISFYLTKSSMEKVKYTRKLQYFIQFFEKPPIIYNAKKEELEPSELKEINLKSSDDKYVVLSTLNSNLFFWFFITFSDCRNVNSREILKFPIEIETINKIIIKSLKDISIQLMKDFDENAIFQIRNDKRAGLLEIQSFQPRLSKSIIDEIDKILAQHYGFTDEELDFIINYDIKYRMGSELSEDGGEE